MGQRDDNTAEPKRHRVCDCAVRNNFDDRYFTDKYQALPRFGYTPFIASIFNHPNIEVRGGRMVLGGDMLVVTGVCVRVWVACRCVQKPISSRRATRCAATSACTTPVS